MELDCSIADQINHLNSQINVCSSRMFMENQYAQATNVFNSFYMVNGNACVNTFQWNANALVPAIYKPPNHPDKEIWKETNEYWIVIDHQVGKLKLLSIVWKNAHDPLKRIKLEE